MWAFARAQMSGQPGHLALIKALKSLRNVTGDSPSAIVLKAVQQFLQPHAGVLAEDFYFIEQMIGDKTFPSHRGQ